MQATRTPPTPGPEFLAPTDYLDFEHPDVRAFVAEVTEGKTSRIDRAVALFYAVRDRVRYNPYTVVMTPEGMRASAVLAAGEGFCVQKAVLLAAAARAAGVPARLAFADVRNHLTTPKLMELMGTDVFRFHGLTELYLEGKWVKATPTFNLSLCDRFGVKPLDFDGRADAVLHPYDVAGRRHMEYIHDYGSFADLPYDEMARIFAESYGLAFQRVAERYAGRAEGEPDAFERDAREGRRG